MTIDNTFGNYLKTRQVLFDQLSPTQRQIPAVKKLNSNSFTFNHKKHKIKQKRKK